MPGRTPVRRDDPDYMRLYRAMRPRQQERDRLQALAFRKSEARLRERHRAEFDEIYAQLKAEVGLTSEDWPT